VVQPLGPELLVAIKPIIGFAHWFRTQSAADDAPVLFPSYQAGFGQDAEMFHHGGQRHRKRFGEFADRKIFGFAQPGEHCAARRISQRRESSIEIRS